MEANWKDLKYGFDRTQAYKEWEQQIIARAGAMHMAQRFFETNQIKHTPHELKALYLGFHKMVGEGDMSIFDKLESYLKQKGTL